MHEIITLARKEVSSFFNALIAYVVMSVFLIGVGFFFWLFEYNILETGYASMGALFEYGPFMFLFLIPAITMRSFSEEFKTGTLELLATKPLSDWQIILGKYLAAVFLVFFSLVPTVIFLMSVHWLGDPVGNLDYGATIGAYLGLFFLGAIFAAIGLFTSTLSDNQIIAFVLGVFLCYLFFLAFEFLANISVFQAIGGQVLSLGIFYHYESISRGVIDSRDLLYFLSFIGIALIGTKMLLAYRKTA